MKLYNYIPALLLTLLASCQPAMAGDLPDASLTPGVARPGVTATDLCPVAHTPALRNVSQAEKNQVYAEYGIKPHQGYCAVADGCEVDHLISLEIGGANAIGNLWPEPYSGTIWNAHVKDRYENFLHAQVCSGKMTLSQVQGEISTDWIAGYKSHPELPIPAAP